MIATLATPAGKWEGLAPLFERMCQRLPSSIASDGLARELSRLAPQLFFREVLSRGGWYRPGRIVDREGSLVADDLVQWLEQELALRHDDFHALFDDYADSGFCATRLLGRTHYLAAMTGPMAGDFLQVEIEEMREVLSHELFAGDTVTSIEYLIEAPSRPDAAADDLLLTAPFYRLRRVTDMAAFLRRMAEQNPEPQKLHRFVDAWQSCSAGLATQFGLHWVLAVREHLDRYRQPVFMATPVAGKSAQKFDFVAESGIKGLLLYEALQDFDRQAGYPMAWFFHMLTTKRVSHVVAGALIDDVQAGFSYLPQRDVRIVRDWLHRPYSF